MNFKGYYNIATHQNLSKWTVPEVVESSSAPSLWELQERHHSCHFDSLIEHLRPMSDLVLELQHHLWPIYIRQIVQLFDLWIAYFKSLFSNPRGEINSCNEFHKNQNLYRVQVPWLASSGYWHLCWETSKETVARRCQRTFTSKQRFTLVWITVQSKFLETLWISRVTTILQLTRICQSGSNGCFADTPGHKRFKPSQVPKICQSYLVRVEPHTYRQCSEKIPSVIQKL